MACPICDHTIQRIDGELPRAFYCPRCGTIASEFPDGEEWRQESQAPALVARVRHLCRQLVDVVPLTRDAGERLRAAVDAVAEACALPAEREQFQLTGPDGESTDANAS